MFSRRQWAAAPAGQVRRAARAVAAVVIGVAVAVAGSGGAAPAGTDTADRLHHVTLANGEWPPYLSASLPGYGLVSGLVTEAFAREGIAVHYDFLPWQRAIQNAEQGRFDGTVVWSHSPERDTQFLFSDPVDISINVFFYPKSRPLQWNTLADLRDRTIGATLGYNYGPDFDRLSRDGTLNVEQVSDDEQNMRKLAAGHIQAFIVDSQVGMYLLSRMPGGAERIACDPKPVSQGTMHLLVGRQVPDGAEIIARFNAGLAQLRAEGRLDALRTVAGTCVR